MKSIHMSLTIDQAIQQLNSALKADPKAISKLVSCSVPCNDELRDHPTVQVGPNKENSQPEVGLLGILNGLFRVVNDNGFIGVWMSEVTGIVSHFEFIEEEKCDEI